MKLDITRDINRISTLATSFSLLSLFSLLLILPLPATTRPSYASGPGTDPNPNPYPNPYSSNPPYSEVDHLEQSLAPASGSGSGSGSNPTVTLRIQPSLTTTNNNNNNNNNNINNNNDNNYETITVPLTEVTEYRPEEPRYERARTGLKDFPSELDVKRAIIVDGPRDSDEIFCMFNSNRIGGNGSSSSSSSKSKAPDGNMNVDPRFGTPFVWGEEVSFSGANAISCIAFYWKGEEGQGGIMDVDMDMDMNMDMDMENGY